MGTLLQDLRYGMRMMRTRVGFTVVAVLTLALGIGANTTIFNWIQTLLLHPLPGVARQDDLMVFLGRTSSGIISTVSYPDFVDFKSRNTTLDGILLYDLSPMSMEVGGQAERIWGSIVTGNYFDVLGVKAHVGRTFLPSEDRTPGAAPVLVLGYGLWQRRFAGDANVVGRNVKLNGRDFTIVGVADEGFGGTFSGLNLDAYVPIMMQAQVSPGNLLDKRGNHSFEALARLKPGVSREQAEVDLKSIAEQLSTEYPASNEGRTAYLEPLWNAPWGAQQIFRPVLGVLMFVVGLVLLIACANVANLLLARATSRQREIAVRLSVGATRGRLVRQLLTESVLLAALGGLGGLLLALWSSGLLAVFVPPSEFPVRLALTFGWQEFTFAFGVTLLTGILFGLAPALQSTRPDLVGGLREETQASGGSRRRLRNLLVVGQLALSLLLLICAGLFVRSLINAQNIDPGFQPRNLLLATLDVLPSGYDEPREVEFYRQLVERVEGLPGVTSASVAYRVPLGWSGNSDTAGKPEGYEPGPDEEIIIPFNVVGTRYFETMGIRMVQGVDFGPQHEAHSDEEPVIVNEAFVHRYWPRAEDAIGRRIKIGETWCKVVGVSSTTKIRSLGEDPFPFMYILLAHNPRPEMTLYVRTEGDPLQVVAPLRDLVRAMDASIPLYAIKPMQQHMGISLFAQRMSGTLLSVFGALAMALAAIGVYGVMAYAVSQRTREIGIRMALGARRRDVLNLILGGGVRLIVAGISLGLVGAFATTRFMSSQLLDVSPRDPVIFSGVTVLLASVALAACLFPARRAASVDPMHALRHN